MLKEKNFKKIYLISKRNFLKVIFKNVKKTQKYLVIFKMSIQQANA
jgi:hypothetical protein